LTESNEAVRNMPGKNDMRPVSQSSGAGAHSLDHRDGPFWIFITSTYKAIPFPFAIPAYNMTQQPLVVVVWVSVRSLMCFGGCDCSLL